METSPFNAYLWENWGIRMIDAVVVDPSASYATPLDIASSAVYDSPITANINTDANAFTEFRTARAIEVSETPPVNNGRLISSSQLDEAQGTLSYGETDFETLARSGAFEPDPENDISGPLTTAAFAFDAETNGKIVLVGDSDFVTNGLIVSGGDNATGGPAFTGNTHLFLNGIGWLTDFNEQVRFEPRGVGGALPFILVSVETLDQIAFVTLFCDARDCAIPGRRRVVLAGATMKVVRGPIILVVAFIAVAGALYFQGQEEDRAPASADPTPIFRRVFPDLAASDVTAIEFRIPTVDQTLIIARDNSGFWVSPSVRGALDQNEAATIAGTLALLPYRRSFSLDDDTNLEQYGIAPDPDLLVTFITSDGESHSVAFGDPSFETLTFYTLVDDRDEIFLVERPAADYLLSQFIDPPVLTGE